MITIRMYCGIHRTVEAFIASMERSGYQLHKWQPSYDGPLSVLQFIPPEGAPYFRQPYCQALP